MLHEPRTNSRAWRAGLNSKFGADQVTEPVTQPDYSCPCTRRHPPFEEIYTLIYPGESCCPELSKLPIYLLGNPLAEYISKFNINKAIKPVIKQVHSCIYTRSLLHFGNY